VADRKCHNCGETGHIQWNCPKLVRTVSGTAGRPAAAEVKCYNCGTKGGHLAMNCPSLYAGVVVPEGGGLSSRLIRSGRVEGTLVEDILLDTGCSRTIIREHLVPQDKIQSGHYVNIQCAHGDAVLYPTAKIELEVGGKAIQVEAALSPNLPSSVLLGTDVVELPQLLSQSGPAEEDCLMVTTHAQSKRAEAIPQNAVPLNRVNGDAVAVGGETVPEVIGEEMDLELFEGGRHKPIQTRRQKRAARQQAARQKLMGDIDLDIPQEKLRQNQQTNDSLAIIRGLVNNDNSGNRGFFYRDGLIYRRWVPRDISSGESFQVEQLVLPKPCRQVVLKLGHSIPLAGHLGKNKTQNRILQRFYWPTVYKDVAQYCKTCVACQKAVGRRGPRAPLIPLPIIGEPFERIAMDIVGPLPKSRHGHSYILVLCDYTTRYPEAIPLRSTGATQVAEALVTVFCRVGVPREILTDQGANFMSSLLAEVYKLLNVKSIRTSPYHPQTDGLVERFNQTLKGMIRKVAKKDGKDWDQLLPYLLFAYRKVSQASTGFSPIELLHG